MWCAPKSRKATMGELLDLQGFGHLNQVVSNNKFKHQIGNSMSVNVLKSIITELL
jgi:site-specific DNA-cytosine methylase